MTAEPLTEIQTMQRCAPITVIGVGNPYRHDDIAGLVVLARLYDRFADDPRIRLLDLDGEPVRIIQAWEDSAYVFLIDAVRSMREVGTIHHFQADQLSGIEADGVALGGGHLLGLGEAIDLARALGRLPMSLEVLGIEGGCFDLGEGLTEAVAHACVLAAEHLIVEIEQILTTL